MDKTPWLTAQGITSYDLNNIPKDAAKGIGWLAQFMLGSVSSFATGFAASQTTSPSMSINIAEGQVYEFADVDSEPIGSFADDLTQILQQGHAYAQIINLNASGLSAGQSKWWLIQARFEQVQGVRAGDPTSGRRGFYNSADPSSPLDGVDGLGGIIPTVVAGLANITAIAGVPATSGSNVPPAPSSGCVPLYLVNVAYGQTAITNGEIEVAGPGAYSGYQQAPFLAGLVNQHHLGIAGHAPKIDVTREIQNVVPYVNLPVTNVNPPAVAGMITAMPGIPIKSFGTLNPSGNLAGNIGDEYFNTTSSTKWECVTTGSSSTAVWVQIGVVSTPGIEINESSYPFTPAAGDIYLCDTHLATSGGVANLGASSTYGMLPIEIKNLKNGSQYQMIINPASGEFIEGFGTNIPMELNPGDSVRLGPLSAGGWCILS